MSGPVESRTVLPELKPLARLVDELFLVVSPTLPPQEWDLKEARVRLRRVENSIPKFRAELRGIVEDLDEILGKLEYLVAAVATDMDDERRQRKARAAATATTVKKSDGD